MFVKFTILSLLLITALSNCPVPPPAANFSVNRYEGIWYELGKYQTLGGEIFEYGCKCTKMEIYENNSVINARQSCIQRNKNSTVDAVLIPNGPQGQFLQKIFVNTVDYFVIYLDNDFAIQFDCYKQGLVTNYCIHLMSKTPTASAQAIKTLSDYALNLGLNKNNLQMKITDQSCWNQLTIDSE